MNPTPIIICSGLHTLPKPQNALQQLATAQNAQKTLILGPDLPQWSNLAWREDMHWETRPKTHEALRPALESSLREQHWDLILLLTSPRELLLPLAQTLGMPALLPGLPVSFVLQNLLHIVDMTSLHHDLRASEDLNHAETALSNVEAAQDLFWHNQHTTNDEEMLRTLAPQATIKPWNLETWINTCQSPTFSLSQTMGSAGWIQTLKRETSQASQEEGVMIARVFEARRPFHPGRWKMVADAGWEGVVRVRGFVWMATQMKFVGQWIRAGAAWRLDISGIWWADKPEETWPRVPSMRERIKQNWQEPWGDRRQHLALIGELEAVTALEEALTSCLLDDEEMSLGQLGWRYLQDPLHGLEACGFGEGPVEPAPPDLSLAEAVHSVHFPHSS